VKRAGPPLLVVVAVAALVALLVYGVAQKSDTDRTLDDQVAHGKLPRAPDRRMPVLGARGTRSLADYRGKVVVLNFWASWCDECTGEVPLLEAAHRRLGTRGTVLGVTYLDATPDSEKFIRDHHVTYPSVRDVGAKLGKEYGTKALPETFVLDRRGRIVAISRGALTTERFLDDAIDRAVRE
jgi:cytochrome c biogenesis protein CcmG, thiol:disulfide interchange protein DsbE